MKRLSSEEIERYSRHIVLPEIGMEGQHRIRNASVLLVGIGGLGSAQAIYLAAAGIGRIGLIDDDRVNLSNLQRQVIYKYGDVGNKKVKSAEQHLKKLNPLIEIEPYEARLESSNAMDICARYDIIIDGSDNFASRYLINDVCILLHKPNVYGSVYRFDGQFPFLVYRVVHAIDVSIHIHRYRVRLKAVQLGVSLAPCLVLLAVCRRSKRSNWYVGRGHPYPGDLS